MKERADSPLVQGGAFHQPLVPAFWLLFNDHIESGKAKWVSQEAVPRGQMSLEAALRGRNHMELSKTTSIMKETNYSLNDRN